MCVACCGVGGVCCVLPKCSGRLLSEKKKEKKAKPKKKKAHVSVATYLLVGEEERKAKKAKKQKSEKAKKQKSLGDSRWLFF